MVDIREYDYFVAHQFSNEERDDLREAIEKAFKRCGFNAYYADAEVRQTHILEKIKDSILRTLFGIYDITNTKKPNVFIELGIAMAAGKPFYIICKKGTEIPADLQGLDRIEYKSYKNLTKEIKSNILKREIRRFDETKKLIQKSKKRQKYDKLPEEEILKSCVKLYQAEKLLHRFGFEVEDDNASNQRAWFADLSELRDHIVFGPYEKLPELGPYIAFFKIKIDDNSSMEPILLLDAYGGGFSNRIIRRINFDQPNKYQIFGVEFNYQRKEQMEYRVYNQIQRGKIWIDYIAIIARKNAIEQLSALESQT